MWSAGQVIGEGRYKLIAPLGHGGQGDVWEAEQLGMAGFARTVVLKLVRLRETFLELTSEILWEARIAAMLHHPNIVQVFDVGEEGDFAYLAMEHIFGRTLHSLAQRHNSLHQTPLPWPAVVFVMMQVCEGLEYAHNLCSKDGLPLQLVHRDLKPQNIMVTREGYVKIIDFGVVKTMGLREETEDGVLKGTPAFMSPEQVLAKEIDKRSDLFSLGSVLYEACCGKRAFEGNSLFEVLRNITNCEPEPLTTLAPHLPHALIVLVENLLQLDPINRPQTAETVRSRLDDVFRHTRFSRHDLKSLYTELMGEEDDPSLAQSDTPPQPKKSNSQLLPEAMEAPVTEEQQRVHGESDTDFFAVPLSPETQKYAPRSPEKSPGASDEKSLEPLHSLATRNVLRPSLDDVDAADAKPSKGLPHSAKPHADNLSPLSLQAKERHLPLPSGDSFDVPVDLDVLSFQDEITPPAKVVPEEAWNTSEEGTSLSEETLSSSETSPRVIAMGLVIATCLGALAWLVVSSFSSNSNSNNQQASKGKEPQQTARRVPKRRTKQVVPKPQQSANREPVLPERKANETLPERAVRPKPPARRLKKLPPPKTRKPTPSRKKAPAWGRIRFSIQPRCVLYSGRRRLGEAQGLTIRRKSGRYRFRCRNKTLKFAATLYVRVRAGRLHRVSRTYRKGKLFFVSYPWASVHLPPFGKIGVSQSVLELWEGRQTLHLYKLGNKSHRKVLRVRIKPGKQTNLPLVRWK